MALTEEQLGKELEDSPRKTTITRAQARADRRKAWQESGDEIKEEMKATQVMVTSAKLTALADEIKVTSAEVRKMYEAGIKQLGDKFGLLVDKHLELAMGDTKEAIQERRFLIKLFADLRPDVALQTSANDLMMAAGRKALESGNIKLVRDSIEITNDSSEPESIGTSEAPFA